MQRAENRKRPDRCGDERSSGDGEAGSDGEPEDGERRGQEVAGREGSKADAASPQEYREREQEDADRQHQDAADRMREVPGSEAGEQCDPECGLDGRVHLDDVRPIVYETTVEIMARPVNPIRRSQTLAAAADYVLAHGLAGLSLRPLAKALDTSPRMLLYDFGSKERLVAAVLAEIRRREERLLDADVHTLEEVWAWIAAPEREAFLRLFFEVYVDAMKRGEASPFVREWVDFLASRVDEATATLLIAVVRGLLLDRLATGDKGRTDAALAVAARALRAF